jgi:hypothetical protein
VKFQLGSVAVGARFPRRTTACRTILTPPTSPTLLMYSFQVFFHSLKLALLLWPGASEVDHYDPEADDQDETWVATHRTGRTSDAVLSCPACFATLCIDCQQHELYSNQFRAMFVTNCTVKEGEVLRAPPQVGERKRGRRRGSGEGESLASFRLPTDFAVCDVLDILFHC